MLLHATAGVCTDPGIVESVAAIGSMLSDQARSQPALLRAALHPSLALGGAVSHILLSALGNPDDRADQLFRTAASSAGSARRELPPYGLLEKLWISEIWGNKVPDDEWDRVLAASCLAGTPDLVGGSREDAYAVTHALMYVTDFGARRRAMPRPNPELMSDIEALLAITLERQDYDLVGELLMTWPFLGVQWSTPALFAFRLLTRVEDHVGLLPGGTTDAQTLRALSGERRRAYAIGTAYHTAFAMGMLCAASLRSDREPSSDAPVFVGGDTGAEPPARIQGDEEPVEVVLGDLTDAARDALSPFLLDLAVARDIRNRAYGELARRLARARSAGEPASPLQMQAVGLLDRLPMAVNISTPHTEVVSATSQPE
ncbi:MAG: hypothetical protein H0U52_01675 [Chloroflexi bacterium]|nr:hypothetical protein [Chloroflexota bacterium]